MKVKLFFLLFLFSLCVCRAGLRAGETREFPVTDTTGPGETLRQQLQRLADMPEAEVGIAVMFNGEDTLTVNNHRRYPLMSVVKLHQALAVADACRQRGVTFDTLIHIRPQDLKPDTYSPLRDSCPEGNFSLSVARLLEYTLQQSDNNACDILFREFGGPVGTDRFLRRIGLRDFMVAVTEEEMHRELMECYRNWTTPLEAVRLLEELLSGRAVQGEYRDFIVRTMMECRTGADRLPAPLAGTEARIGHKTGTGDRNRLGQIIGVNDVGFVLLPDGRRYSIAVFVRNAETDIASVTRLIAEVSAAVYHHVSQQPQE